MSVATPTSITFTQIPNTLQVPGDYLEFSGVNANNGAAATSYVYLIMGQMLTSGSGQPLVPVRISGGKQQSDQLFGQGSMLSNMVTAAVNANSMTETWALPTLDNAAGTASTGSILFSGTASQAGTITLYVGYSGLIAPAQVSVNVGDTAATVAKAAALAINEVLDLPATAAVDGTAAGKVVLTARHKGIAAGQIDIRLLYYSTDLIPAGLAATVTAMAGGAGEPSATAMVAAISDAQYHVIACPWTDQATYSAWYAEMTRRWNAMVSREGCLVSALRGTPGTLASGLSVLNSQFLDCYCSQGTPTPGFVEAAIIGALYASSLESRPNAPMRGTLLPGLMAPALADRFTLAERNTLYIEGGSSWITGSDGAVTLEKAVTTYKTNAAGISDTTYHGRWVMATLTYLRSSWIAWMSTKFLNATFADDGTAVISGEVTPQILGNESLAWYQAMIVLGLVQDPIGFKTNLVSIRNTQNHARNDQLLVPRLVGPLDIVAAQMAFEE